MMFAFNIDLHIIRNIDKKVTEYPGCLTQESEAISKAFWLPRAIGPVARSEVTFTSRRALPSRS